jgi:hypothetical protein
MESVELVETKINYADLTSSELRKATSELSMQTLISLTVSRNEAYKFPCEKWATFTHTQATLGNHMFHRPNQDRNSFQKNRKL